MVVKLGITRSHINNGISLDAYECPLAVALKDGHCNFVKVAEDEIIITLANDGDKSLINYYKYKVEDGSEVSDFIKSVDHNIESVKPCSLSIEFTRFTRIWLLI